MTPEQIQKDRETIAAFAAEIALPVGQRDIAMLAHYRERSLARWPAALDDRDWLNRELDGVVNLLAEHDQEHSETVERLLRLLERVEWLMENEPLYRLDIQDARASDYQHEAEWREEHNATLRDIRAALDKNGRKR